MYGILGNYKGKVKPWYLPFDWVFCRISINYKTRVVIVKNSSVANVWALPVKINDGIVVGVWENIAEHSVRLTADNVEDEIGFDHQEDQR